METIRRIFSLPYDNIKIKGLSSRRDLALDCFRLSFCLMGINSADLFSAEHMDSDKITYNRLKTKDRRSDKAEIKVYIQPHIREIVDKYKGNAKAFNFSERFSTMESFNRAINIGLKEIGKE